MCLQIQDVSIFPGNYPFFSIYIVRRDFSLYTADGLTVDLRLKDAKTMNIRLSTKALEMIRTKARPYEIRDTDLPGFLLRVQPTGVMTYYLDFRTTSGLRKRIRIGRIEAITIPQARDLAKVFLGQVAQGQDPSAIRKRERLSTLGVYIESTYGPWARANLKRGDETVSRLKRRFSSLMTLRLDEINVWKLDRWILDRKKTDISGATINRNVGMLKSAFSKAIEWDIISRHPLQKLRPQRVDQSSKVRFLTPEEERRLWAALDRRENQIRTKRDSGNLWRIVRGHQPRPALSEELFVDHLKPMVLLSLNTGIRQGELFSLNWEDIDFSNRTLTIRGEEAKSGQTRHIPLNSIAYSVLESLLKNRVEKHALVFPNREGQRFNNIKRSWKRLLIDAGITTFRYHDARHHFASKLAMVGVDLNTIRELLGHGDIKMTLKYAHLSPSAKAAAVERITAPVVEASPKNKIPYSSQTEN